MRKGLLGSIAALAAGAGTALAQPPAEPAGMPAVAPGLTAPGQFAPQPPIGGPPRFGGLPSHAIPGNSGYAPPAVVMPPGNYGPPGDPLGLGPVGGFGPPPGPQYPVPGPYGAAQYQPAPTGGGAGGRGGPGGMGDNGLGYGEAPRWWFDAEYLLWFTRDQQVNTPLLTTSAPANGGLVGSASTTVLVGNRDLNYGAISGYRLTAGFYGDADRRFGFQLSGFSTERKSNSRRFGALSSTASGIPVLARPFVDVNGVPSAVVLSGPDFGAANRAGRHQPPHVGHRTGRGVEPVPGRAGDAGHLVHRLPRRLPLPPASGAVVHRQHDRPRQ